MVRKFLIGLKCMCHEDWHASQTCGSIDNLCGMKYFTVNRFRRAQFQCSSHEWNVKIGLQNCKLKEKKDSNSDCEVFSYGYLENKNHVLLVWEACEDLRQIYLHIKYFELYRNLMYIY